MFPSPQPFQTVLELSLQIVGIIDRVAMLGWTFLKHLVLNRVSCYLKQKLFSDEIAKPVTNRRCLVVPHCCHHQLLLVHGIPLKNFRSPLWSEACWVFPGSTHSKHRKLRQLAFLFSFPCLALIAQEQSYHFIKEAMSNSVLADGHWKLNFICICPKPLFCRYWRDGSAVKSSHYSCRDPVVSQQPADTLACDSSCRTSDSLFWLLGHSHSHACGTYKLLKPYTHIYENK